MTKSMDRYTSSFTNYLRSLYSKYFENKFKIITRYKASTQKPLIS